MEVQRDPIQTEEARAPGREPEDSAGAASRRERPREEGSGELDLTTLGLAALGSALAALITSQLWENGAIIGAAVTPVIISLVKEGLRSPAERVTSAGARVASASKSGLAAVTPRPGVGPEPDPGAPSPPPPGRPASPPSPPGDGRPPAKPGDTRLYGLRKRFRWRHAIVTGLVAFLIAAVVLTVPELVFGGAPGRDGGTTLFGGGEPSAAEEPDAPAQVGSEEQPTEDPAAPSPEAQQQAPPEEEPPAPEEEPAEPAAPQGGQQVAPSGTPPAE